MLKSSWIACWRVQFLAQQHQSEARVRIEVSLPESPWFLEDPKEPFAAATPYDRRRPSDRACHHVESGPHSDQHRCIQSRTVRPHPAILLRGTQSNPYDVGSRRVDAFNDRMLLPGQELTEGRRADADHLRAWVVSGQIP